MTPRSEEINFVSSNQITSILNRIDTPLLRKSLALLGHPFTFGALFVLLLNDHWWRRVEPSWWTGKIGDFAWLFFAPLALAVLLALVLPRIAAGQIAQEKIIGFLAFGSVGGLFSLAKILPGVRDALGHTSLLLFGAPLAMTADPTDLIALPALLASAWMWFRQPNQQPLFPERGWVALPLAALLTIANSAAPNHGITCLAQTEQGIQAVSSYWAFTSTDGGITWTGKYGAPKCSPNAKLNLLVDTRNPNIQYRLSPGKSIERTTDGGNAWQIVFQLDTASEAQKAYYLKTYSGSLDINPGPHDAILDTATGNMIFAMGHEGVLIYKPDGSWSWAGVGEHRRAEMSQISAIFTLLRGELALAGALLLLLLSAWRLRLPHRWLRKVFVIVGWAAWVCAIFLFPSALAYGYGAMISGMLVAAASLIALPVGIEAGIGLFRKARRRFWSALVLALAGALLFLLPYVLWSLNTLPVYTWASVFALIIGLIVLAAGLLLVRNPDSQ